MLFQLKCGHIQHKEAGSSTLPIWGQYVCEACQKLHVLTHVEGREWHIACMGHSTAKCRYGRWCGSSKPLAEQYANEHLRKHPSHTITCDFVIHRDNKEAARVQYLGHRVYLFLVKETIRPLTAAQIQSDIPPF
jgi:hypothetical protein